MKSASTAIGLMSGTSLDGIDIALLRTDGMSRVERGPSASYPYEPAFRRLLAEALETAKAIRQRDERPGNLAAIERELTRRHGEAVRRFLGDNALRLSDIDLVGFHGQTVLHRPLDGLTVQLGLGDLLADDLGLPVVYDMRANDMLNGGEGAPLAPAYHGALAEGLPDDLRAMMPAVFVNIGGISNVTYVGSDGRLIAFDSGPGNTLIDQWVERHAGVPFDQDGMIASEGVVVTGLAERYLANAFFTDDRRRSLDRNDFLPPSDDEAELSDGARTLAYVTAAAILKAAAHFPEPPGLWIVCGGGRKNRLILSDMQALADEMGARVVTAEEAGLDGDAMEAEAWAYLAVRSLHGLALTWPETTHVKGPVSGGVLALPRDMRERA
ncbi:anhydro-N-acetylmuramic acid kinase [Pararhizobium haloflavum]|uniref:anhydro-N-acetylmuramic acid kinase n=1 Tax=Pararhizobium haloflavum TaxID=2037914 RepID=UPI000C18D4AA|nr:anhydro-N-acetylmuramic acid kinase [Pararhizobium haloflavum]